ILPATTPNANPAVPATARLVMSSAPMVSLYEIATVDPSCAVKVADPRGAKSPRPDLSALSPLLPTASSPTQLASLSDLTRQRQVAQPALLMLAMPPAHVSTCLLNKLQCNVSTKGLDK